MRIQSWAARWLTALMVAALVATTLLLVGGAPRSVELKPTATNTQLCSGYSGCKDAGYSDAGYGAVSGKMYWRMYSGHNCTNYAAYRVIKNGGPASRPWSGGGNASEWGLEMSDITDQTPTVGSIAWWARYDNGSGSAGHVAYVEKVVSSNEIIISEDSWGGTFHWRRISKDSGRWPTGFIHFADDKKLTQTAAPVVTGTPQVGTKLKVNTGSWSPKAYTAVRWLVDGTPVPGAKWSGYELRPDDYGKRVSVEVTAKRSGYASVVVTTDETAAVAKGTLENTAPPVVSGDPIVGEELKATGGTWNQSDATLEYRWLVDGVRQSVPEVPTFELKPAHVGKEISSVVVARKDGYRAEKVASTTAVGPVFAGRAKFAASPDIKGVFRVGRVLSVVPGSYRPSTAAVSYQWLRNGAPIAGETSAKYALKAEDAGARVTVRTTLSKPDYKGASYTVASTPRVTVAPRIGVYMVSRKRQVTLSAKVTATGVTRVSGKVQIKVGRLEKTVWLRDGVARQVKFGPLGLGNRRVSVRFLGNPVVLAKGRVGSIDVVAGTDTKPASMK